MFLPQAEELNSIKIFHYCGSLNFASRSSFKTELCSLIRLDLASEMRNNQPSTSQRYESIHFKCLIIDFSALSYIDPSGVSLLKLLIRDFNKLSINVYIAGASCKCIIAEAILQRNTHSVCLPQAQLMK